jgi:nitroimidazol reductase NimA-like FMN-containing flavoprotein (pyridoxamine 5'-phosphate oxidase superfamily)
MTAQPMSPRTTVRRGAHRAEYGTDIMLSILRAGQIAHVGVNTNEGPLVLPMAYGVTEDVMYLHGALANSLLKAGNDGVCATVTLLDGLVIAKTSFNNTMNYRSVVVRGTPRPVTEATERLEALRIITDHIVKNWEHLRYPSEAELRATRIIALPLDEMSAKVRSGPPTNDDVDATAGHWCGEIPLASAWGSPVTAPDSGAPLPSSIAALANRPVTP